MTPNAKYNIKLKFKEISIKGDKASEATRLGRVPSFRRMKPI